MEITQAFTQEAVELADALLDEEEETELRTVIEQVYANNEVDPRPEDINVAVLCFIAGQTRQWDAEPEPKVTLRMSQKLANDVMEYFAQKLEETGE